VDTEDRPRLRSFYRQLVNGRRVLLADDVLNTGQTLQQCAEIVRAAGGTVLAALVICDRLARIVDIGAPVIALTEYAAQENYPADQCPLCRAGTPVTAF
jgi:orotate phosphoribosyltransferase